MDTDRPPHRSTSNSSSSATATTTATNICTTNTSSELFICFTSRLSSSSSMKLPTKSILSPGRGRDSSQISLSTSLSRRLRNSGSLKGGQASPMFPATTNNGKKRGCSFENPEPSSPKVTCIGQVRVKTKKQGKKMRARSRREVSFRRTEQGIANININSASTNSNCNGHNNLDVNHYQDFVQGHPQECLPHRNQRWVHLPVTICEALRTFGAEFNCFLPCRSSCMASNNKEEKVSRHHHHTIGDANANRSDSSCGAVFARWLVVGGEEERNCSIGEAEDEDDMPRSRQRRHVFEDIVIEGDKCELKNEIFEEEKEKEEEGRVSICIPPKNALLLMRCRSDPVKMAALANRFWECPPPQEVEVAENEEEEEAEEEVRKPIVEEARIPEAEAEQEAELEAQAQVEAESKGVSEVVQEEELQQQVQEEEEVEEEDKQVLDQPAVLEAAAVEGDSYTEALPDPDNEQNVAQLVQANENFLGDEAEPAPKLDKREAFDDLEDKRPSFSCSSEVLPQQEQESEVAVADDSTEQKEEEEEEEEEETETTRERSEPEEPKTGQQSKEGASQKETLLPDCLLLMMCEPKLSMEVSKETWVCSTDFIRWQPSENKPPPQIANKADGCDEKPKKRVSVDSATPAPQQQKQPQLLLMQPPRSSCSFPAAPPLPPALGAPSAKTMNTMIEQKLVGAKPSSYEPFALTRCKSEPRKQSAKLAPETCFWKNRKIEPHRPATLGVGAAGVGF